MKYEYHFVATVTISSIIYAFTNSVSAFAISFASGFLIDVDHLLDYRYQNPRLEFSCREIKSFFNWCKGRRFEYLALIFHSLEYVFLLWFLIYRFNLGIFWTSFAIGITQHMFFDLIFNFHNTKTHFFYIIILRALKGFRFQSFKR